MAKVVETRTVSFGGKQYKVAATLGAAVTYAGEFRGKVVGPYSGLMADDMIALYNACNQKRYVPSEDGSMREVDNDEYVGIEASIEPLLRIMWAMAKACGLSKRWREFRNEALEAEFVATELGSMYETIVNDLGDGVIFRLPEGQGGSEKADEKQEG